MKNIIKLQNYYLPEELEREITVFVKYYNHHRYHKSLNNLTPADVYFGRAQEVLTRRQEIKQRTLEQRRLLHQQAALRYNPKQPGNLHLSYLLFLSHLF